MRYHIIALVALCALLALWASAPVLAEDMPVVVDQPLTSAEVAVAEAERAEQRRVCQQLLIDLGYLTGKADGIIGPRSAAALEEFQRDFRLKVTGELDADTEAALLDLTETVENAEALQQRLTELRYMYSITDGIFGERSQAALKLFQLLNGLEVTGKADEDTRQKLFAEDAEALPEQLTDGSKGEAVTAIQEKLKQLGFLTGRVDGSYGKSTTAAVKRFQQHLLEQGVDPNLDIQVSGVATAMTQKLLLDPDYTSYVRDLAPGDTGEEVRRVESRLNLLGYMDRSADETFDDYAVQAAGMFREDAGLTGDAFDRAFIDALFSENAPTATRYLPHDILSGDEGRAVREVEEALVRGGMMTRTPIGKYDTVLVAVIDNLHRYLVERGSPYAALFANPKSLTLEAQRALETDLLGYVQDVNADCESKDEIRRVQCRLYWQYYLQKYNVDGVFGASTVEALKAFQEANGLPVTGAADRATQLALLSDDSIRNPRPYRVEVDIDNQRVYVYERNESGGYDKTQEFVCSTGLNDATPRGIYLDGFPANIWHEFGQFSNTWARYSYEIEGNIMFHSVLFSEPDAGKMYVDTKQMLGQKASHGCIRLAVEDAKWIFENCKKGTLVIVIY